MVPQVGGVANPVAPGASTPTLWGSRTRARLVSSGFRVVSALWSGRARGHAVVLRLVPDDRGAPASRSGLDGGDVGAGLVDARQHGAHQEPVVWVKCSVNASHPTEGLDTHPGLGQLGQRA